MKEGKALKARIDAFEILIKARFSPKSMAHTAAASRQAS
jgi:hypothetical protein